MDDKPRVRVPAGSSRLTLDSFQNVNQRLGLGAGSQMDGSGYSFNFISRNRLLLEAAYRTSWIVGRIVDAIADDMTKAGLEFKSALKPDEEELMYAAWRDLLVGQHIGDGIRWGRLYGGAIALMMIDGQDVSTPLNIESVTKGKFRGLMILDRWIARADMSDIVTELGPDFGLPRYYDVIQDRTQGINVSMRIHYSRVLRFLGIPLPYYQRNIEMLWGQSVLERLWDRLIAFDSTTLGAAQLVFKAHLRTLKIPGYRNIVAAGGKMFEGLMAQIENMRLFQNTEGVTVMDGEDTFETHSFTFAGLDDVLTSMGDQVCGATEIPRVRLFGDSPGGLNADGESALRTYYDEIGKKQNTTLRRPTQLVLDVMSRSVLGKPLPDGFNYEFRPMWAMSEEDKATVAKTVVEAVGTAYSDGMITAKVAAQELRASSRVTGIFSNITDDDIEAMDDEIPDPVELAQQMTEATTPPGEDPSQPGGAGGPKKPAEA
jgi:phage-related protein (TIGR01555 family)